MLKKIFKRKLKKEMEVVTILGATWAGGRWQWVPVRKNISRKEVNQFFESHNERCFRVIPT